jgi:DNA-binding MarR family transcriptional regulator
MQPAVERISECLATIVRRVRLPGADELERAIGTRIDAAGAVIVARLDPSGGTRLSDLAARLGLAPSTVSRQLPPLEAAGYVTRQPDPDDGRASLLYLTATGVGVSERIATYRTTRVHDLLADWSDRDRDVLADLLERFTVSLVEE